MKNAQHIATRAWVLFTLFAFFGAAILIRIALIQVDPSHERAEAMLPQVRTIEPERGRILSSDGHLLAASVPRFDLHWDPTVINTEAERAEFLTLLPALSSSLANEFGGKDTEGWRNFLLDAHRSGRSRYVRIARNIEWDRRQTVEAFPWIAERSRNRSGFMFSEKPRRDKPFSPLANRTIGLHRPEGQSVGIEAAFNEALSGKAGQRLMRRIHGNYWIPASDDFIRPPEAGKDIRTTLDLRTQDVATDALQAQLEHHAAEWGCAVVLEVATGNVIAISNLVRNPETGKCSEAFNHHCLFGHMEALRKRHSIRKSSLFDAGLAFFNQFRLISAVFTETMREIMRSFAMISGVSMGWARNERSEMERTPPSIWE